MAGLATVAIKVDISGLGNDVSAQNCVDMTVPVEIQSGYTILPTATAAIQLFDEVDHIALAKIYGVYIKAESGTVLIAVDTAGTTILTAATADLVLNVGEACYLPINPTGNLGLVINGLTATDTASWLILGKA
jgi:hypothetical protein